MHIHYFLLLLLLVLTSWRSRGIWLFVYGVLLLISCIGIIVIRLLRLIIWLWLRWFWRYDWWIRRYYWRLFVGWILFNWFTFSCPKGHKCLSRNWVWVLRFFCQTIRLLAFVDILIAIKTTIIVDIRQREKVFEATNFIWIEINTCNAFVKHFIWSISYVKFLSTEHNSWTLIIILARYAILKIPFRYLCPS